jgi:hypothetical protein
VHAPGVDVDDSKVSEHCECRAGHEANTAVVSAPTVAFPATFAFQLNRQASFFRKATFHSL